MVWSRSRAEERIKGFQKSVPQTAVSVETFEARYARDTLKRAELGQSKRRYNPLVSIPPSQAVLVDGVHVYVQLTDYHAVMTDQKRERSERYMRALKFLHTHYSATDQIVIEYQAQRVDYHGPRLHAVIATPTGKSNELERIKTAIDFAMAMKRMIEVTGDKVLGGEFKTAVRIGIDSGMAVAVNSGRGSEQEPLFLGNPANYAAKLADGEETGIYLSERVRMVLGMARIADLATQKRSPFTQDQIAMNFVARSVTDQRIEVLAEDVKTTVEPQVRAAEFSFHRHQPPLSSIDYGDLRPSNTIYMEMLSIFADIDNFTKYVQHCIDTGDVKQLVANLHVIRKELAAVLKSDFGGKKVRFIGDCLHGLVAEGSVRETDAAGTIETAVLCAGAMRSSFELCQEMLPGIKDLGLAIGLEYGSTPVTRLGTRGDLSVRCATSRAVSESERLQSELDGDETALGSRALSKASLRVKKLFDQNGRQSGLDYRGASVLLMSAPAVATAAQQEDRPEFRGHARR
ncbi:adenylate/guanylate cyclase domain-containing protein [Devosia lacusdianchii]|uniref:adenylate/guanylate cyclase domain-containing protein n=1 Tax=Devosia lacusdianchii TaxID=2917991 RepID=UPI001F05E402|nr:adenylate/guanylate cyclase domain-containing protein [Devosia sp. JXJ CY 41]